MINDSNKTVNITIIGARLDTGNLGVSALLASTVGWIYKVHPNVQFKIFDGVPDPTPQIVKLENGKKIHIERIGVRINKTIWRQNHLVRLLLEALIGRLIPVAFRDNWLSRNPFMQEFIASNIVFDISGGDSFTDNYGAQRMLKGFLKKLLVIISGLDLILLPQTYGPFKTFWSKILARFVFKKAKAVYSRDEQGLEYIKKVMKGNVLNPIFCPDVAFGLNSYEPDYISILPSSPVKNKDTQVVGFNISGLLFSGGYSQDNMFNLNVNYKECVFSLINTLMNINGIKVILIPHVFPKEGFSIESDPYACSEVYESIIKRFPGRIHLLKGKYDQNEIKWIIGNCDFLIGSRMHACIAAASQGIPTVALAYSKKFKGVFQSIGIDNLVIDLRTESLAKIEKCLLAMLDKKEIVSNKLIKNIEPVQEKIHEVFRQIILNE